MNTIWHPYTQMQTAETPLEIVKGKGEWLYTKDGRKILDGISSWWVTVHGHSNPVIAEAISKQALELEQVIFAGFTHPQAEKLADRLIKILPEKIKHVFYSDNGSTCVEVGIKMAWQYWFNQGKKKTKIAALNGGYHGDTFGAMSVSGRSIFTKSFEPLLFEVTHFQKPDDNHPDIILDSLKSELAGGDYAAFVLEPLIMAAGGMHMYSPALLDQIITICRENNVLVIFDEVMTGFYRTGKMFAADHCTQKPDIICLSKGLSGGFLPLSVTACTSDIYEAFLSDDRTKTLFHGHSFTANPIACAAANASLDLFEQADTQKNIEALTSFFANQKGQLKKEGRITNPRSMGTVLAFELVPEEKGGYLDPLGKRLAKWYLDRNYLVRPLGNTFYLLPPYCTQLSDLQKVLNLLPEALDMAGGKIQN